ncbi:MAG: class I SAM-dependent methyltransferase [Limnochordaceae bacterium]|nr:class I SAM-dependent methyltransferase [Limnochordaceae bacterium]
MSLPMVRVVAVTTGRDPAPAQEILARRLASRLGVDYVPRSRGSLGQTGLGPQAAVVVVERGRLTIRTGQGALRYHPGMALHRIRLLRSGGLDPMVQAMGLRPGDRVLDATVGPAWDALVAAWATGEQGEVLGLEKVPALALLTAEGLRAYPWPSPDVAAAASRIRIEAEDHLAFLRARPAGSFDVVYFDVMFQQGLPGSQAMRAWRELADPGELTPEALALARIVARRRVVVKERRDSERLALLQPPRLEGGSSSRVVYAVWESEAGS